MNWVKGFAVATCLAASLSAVEATTAAADPAKPAASDTDSDVGAKGKKPTKAMLEKCTNEANAKGLYVKSGKGEERKAFRRTCVRKAMGLEK